MSVSRRVFGRFFFLHKSKKGVIVVEKRSRKTKKSASFSYYQLNMIDGISPV